MDQPIKRILFPILAVIVLLTACAPSPAATQNPEELQQLIQQSVAMAFATQNAQATQHALTLAAQYTQTATQPAVSIPSSTPLATATAESEFVSEEIATDTQAPTLTSTPRNTVTPSPVIPKYACDAFASSPRYLEVMSPGQKFDIEWVIINTGTKTWEPGIDVAYSGGSKLTGVTVVEIPHEMKYNDRYSILLHAKAPDKPGIYYMNFTVQGPGCAPYVAIQVGE